MWTLSWVTAGDTVTLPVSGTGTSTDVGSSVCVGPVTVWDEQVETGPPDVARCVRRGRSASVVSRWRGCTGRRNRNTSDGKGFSFEDRTNAQKPGSPNEKVHRHNSLSLSVQRPRRSCLSERKLRGVCPCVSRSPGPIGYTCHPLPVVKSIQ